MTFEEVYEKYHHLVPITIERKYGDIKYLADKYKIEVQDLIQMGNIGLWNAYKNYDKNKSNFQTYAINNIFWSVSNELKLINQDIYWKYNDKKLSEENLVTVESFDKNLSKEEEPFTYEDILENENPICDIESIVITNNFIDLLEKDVDKKVARLLLQGNKAIDIAKKLGVNRQRISQRIKRIRKQLKEVGVGV